MDDWMRVVSTSRVSTTSRQHVGGLAGKQSTWRSGNLTFVAPARWIYERALSSILSHTSNRIVHIPNGVDTSLFYREKRSDRGNDGIRMLVSAQSFRTNRSKDFTLLKAALKLIAERLRTATTLTVIGDDGPTEEHGLVTITFAGPIRERSDVAAVFRSADIYIHPTQVETFCLSILEALASGCAVISTAAGGVDEQLEPSSSEPRGLMVPQGDPQALANGVLQLILDHRLRTSLSGRASSFVKANWTLNHHVDAHLSLYEQTISRMSALVP